MHFPVSVGRRGLGRGYRRQGRPAPTPSSAACSWAGPARRPSPPPPPPPPYETAPQGDWVGTYGVNGYDLAAWNGTAGDLAVLPAGVTATLEQGVRATWAASTSDVRALQAPSGSERRATTLADTSQVRVRLTFNAAYSGNLHLYALDWDSTARRQNVTVNDGTTTKTVQITSSFNAGAWMHFPVSVPAGGSVVVTVEQGGRRQRRAQRPVPGRGGLATFALTRQDHRRFDNGGLLRLRSPPRSSSPVVEVGALVARETGVVAAPEARRLNSDAFRCPQDGNRLQQLDQSLVCQPDGHVWPFRDGIPRFVASQGYAGAFGFQWARHAQTQLDSHNGLTLSRDRWFAVTGWPDRMDGQRMLEAGSGPGRFTEVAASTGADVVSFDYSTAIDQNHANNGRFTNVTFAQADLLHPPVARESFDRVFCMGVLQHLPSPDEGFSSLAGLVAPGGWLVVDCYQRTAIALLHWKYVLRPMTRRMRPDRLYGLIERGVRDCCRPGRPCDASEGGMRRGCSRS